MNSKDRRDAVNLAQALTRGASWRELWAILEGLKDQNAESIRHVVRDYVTKVVLNTESEKRAAAGMKILDEFSQPWDQADGITPVVLAVGRIVLPSPR